MHWRALSALWLLLLISTLGTAHNDSLTSITTVLTTSITDGRKAAGEATRLLPTDVLAVASAKDGAATDDSGSPTILTTSVRTTATASVTHKPQIISTAVGGAHPHTGVVSHTRTLTSANSTKTHVFSFHPHTQPTARPLPPASPDPDTTDSDSRMHQSAVAIVFEVIGGLAGLLLLCCCTRCIINYKRTPRRDRIAAVVDRHLLERELAEMEEARPRIFRAEVVVPPPPPYQRAPDYDEVVRGHSPGSSSSSGSETETEAETHRPP